MLSSYDIEKFKSDLADPEVRRLRVESQIRVGVPLQIRAMRELRGWTQQELAEKLETTQNTISRLENPKSMTPNVSTLQRLAEAFDVGLLVRFAPYSDFWDFSRKMSKDSVAVPDFETEVQEIEKRCASVEATRATNEAFKKAFLSAWQEHDLKGGLLSSTTTELTPPVIAGSLKGVARPEPALDSDRQIHRVIRAEATGQLSFNFPMPSPDLQIVRPAAA